MGVEEIPQNQVTEDLKINVLPNPCTGVAKISFKLWQQGIVKCAIYDVMGREIKQLTSTYQLPGSYSLVWDRKDNAGSSVRSGVYFVRISTEQIEEQVKLILLK